MRKKVDMFSCSAFLLTGLMYCFGVTVLLDQVGDIGYSLLILALITMGLLGAWISFNIITTEEDDDE